MLDFAQYAAEGFNLPVVLLYSNYDSDLFYTENVAT